MSGAVLQKVAFAKAHGSDQSMRVNLCLCFCLASLVLNGDSLCVRYNPTGQLDMPLSLQVQALRSVEKYLQLDKLYVLGTNCVDNGPREGLDKFLQAASSSPDTVLHYEFMQVHHCPAFTAPLVSASVMTILPQAYKLGLQHACTCQHLHFHRSTGQLPVGNQSLWCNFSV